MEMGRKQYICQAGESFDSVALVLYGDEDYAADLIRANPMQCGKLWFDGGEALNVPILDIPDDDGAVTVEAAPWEE